MGADDDREFITLHMTRETAKKYGLLTCKNCWYPENNHFDFGERTCAHAECKGFEEYGRIGVSIL